METQLSINQVTKQFSTGEGVFNFSLDVKKGELVSLLGPSGCGKTTMLRTIGGFLEPDQGEIKIAGKSILGLPPNKRPTAMVFQGYNLWPHMTVFKNLAFGLKIRRKSMDEIKERIDWALKLVHLPNSENKLPSELSGGQQQRVALARALLLQPEVLLLDEPFSALDAKLRFEMREELREIQAETGTTMVFVTHDQEEALSISDRIVVMNSGKVEQIDTPQEIYDQPSSLFVAKFIGRMNFLKGVARDSKLTLNELELPIDRLLGGDITLATRPEDVIFVEDQEPGIKGTIRHVMVLGHYAEVAIDTDFGMIKMFVSREKARQLSVNQSLKLAFDRMQFFETA